jgi:thioredoxin-dependent peroxiredoxin
LDAVVLGVSRDNLKSHQQFSQKLNLPFSLLVDQDQHLHTYFGVLKEKKLFGKIGIGTERSTFILNQDGILIKEFRNVKSKGHAEEVLEYLTQNESVK